MTTETAANTAGDVAKEIAKVAATGAAYAAVEVVGAVAILVAVGFVAKKLQDRKATKTLAVVSE